MDHTECKACKGTGKEPQPPKWAYRVIAREVADVSVLSLHDVLENEDGLSAEEMNDTPVTVMGTTIEDMMADFSKMEAALRKPVLRRLPNHDEDKPYKLVV